MASTRSARRQLRGRARRRRRRQRLAGRRSATGRATGPRSIGGLRARNGTGEVPLGLITVLRHHTSPLVRVRPRGPRPRPAGAFLSPWLSRAGRVGDLIALSHPAGLLAGPQHRREVRRQPSASGFRSRHENSPFRCHGLAVRRRRWCAHLLHSFPARRDVVAFQLVVKGRDRCHASPLMSRRRRWERSVTGLTTFDNSAVARSCIL